MPPLQVTRAGVIGTVAVLAVASVCARLGFWQLDRLQQRRDRNAEIQARLAAPPVRLTAGLADTAGLAYRNAVAAGEYDDARTIVLAGRAHQGAPGVHLLTPLRLGGGRAAVLVDRGWVPSPDAASVDLARFPVAGRPTRVAGLLLGFPAPAGGEPAAHTGRTLFRLDAATLRGLFPYPVLGVYLQAAPVRGTAALPVRLGAPTLTEGSHLSYAVQWFSFAAIALVGWVVLAIRNGEVRLAGEDR